MGFVHPVPSQRPLCMCHKHYPVAYAAAIGCKGMTKASAYDKARIIFAKCNYLTFIYVKKRTHKMTLMSTWIAYPVRGLLML